MSDKMQTQRAEFDAAEELSKQLKRHDATPIVDDDYPNVRYDYERALRAFIDAMKANGRFKQGNMYGLVQP